MLAEPGPCPATHDLNICKDHLPASNFMQHKSHDKSSLSHIQSNCLINKHPLLSLLVSQPCGKSKQMVAKNFVSRHDEIRGDASSIFIA
jgi:hypothetical protein